MTTSIPFDAPKFSLAGSQRVGRVVSVYDGDTCTVVLPLFDGHYKFQCRLYGIDTSERKSHLEENKVRAEKARHRLIELIVGHPVKTPERNVLNKKEVEALLRAEEAQVIIDCREFDKYGRLLVTLRKNVEDISTMNDQLIAEGLAYAYFGDTKLTETEQSTNMTS